MKVQINEKNGEVLTDPDKADIIIAKSNTEYIDKDLENLEKYQSKIVTEKWYYNCITKNEYHPIDEKKDLFNLSVINNDYEKIITEIESGKNVKYINLFIGKIFCIQGFREEIKSKIIEIISFCNGFYFDIILESTNYVIVPLNFNNINIIQNKENIFGIKPTIVTCNWFLDCIKEGILLSPSLYKPTKYMDEEKKLYLSDILKGESFSICRITYEKDLIKEIKEKIEQNMGLYFDEGNSRNISNFKAKYIIMNDGYPYIWNKLITENLEKNLGKLIISHRFLDECLTMGKIIEYSDFLDSIPYPFAVPIEEFKNRYFYLPKNQFCLQERFSYAHLIRTFGGNVDELNEKITHILFKKKESNQKTIDEMIKCSNKNVKFIKEEYFTDYILLSGECDINKYQMNQLLF